MKRVIVFFCLSLLSGAFFGGLYLLGKWALIEAFPPKTKVVSTPCYRVAGDNLGDCAGDSTTCYRVDLPGRIIGVCAPAGPE